jgi:hypothetical protein
MRLGDAPKLARLESGGRELLQPGATVIVRLGEAEGVADAVLVVSTQ